MSIDRHIPIFGESFQRAYVIEMTMRQDDSGGPAASAESGLRGRADVGGGSRQSRIHKRPAAVAGSRRSDEHHVDDGNLPISNIGCDLPCLVVASLVGLRIVCGRGFGEGDLSHVRTLPRCKRVAAVCATRLEATADAAAPV